MNQKDVIAFFDRCAPSWDAQMQKDDAIIENILDNAQIGEGMDVLDVACGTGVMFPYYLSRGVARVTGIDISSQMANIAAGKFKEDSRVTVICGDVEQTVFDRKFDAVVVYNAFPHFPEPRRLIGALASLLKEGGRLTVAHGASREAIDNHHSGSASKVSNGLMEARQLARLFDSHLQTEIIISSNRMYQVTGVKPAPGMHTHGTLVHSHQNPAWDTDMEETVAMMGFMVKHNDAHAQELAELADRLNQKGNHRAYRQIMEAVADFDTGNARLEEVAASLAEE